MPGSPASVEPSTAGAVTTSGGPAAPFKTLLAAGAIDPGVATLAIVAECTAACAAIGLFTIAALRLPLILIEIVRTGLVPVRRRLVLLPIGSCPVLLLIVSGSILLAKVGLVAAALLCQITLTLIPKLLLIVLLVELRCGVAAVEVVRAIVKVVAVNITGVEVVSVDVVSVNIVSIDVIAIDIVVV